MVIFLELCQQKGTHSSAAELWTYDTRVTSSSPVSTWVLCPSKARYFTQTWTSQPGLAWEGNSLVIPCVQKTGDPLTATVYDEKSDQIAGETRWVLWIYWECPTQFYVNHFDNVWKEKSLLILTELDALDLKKNSNSIKMILHFLLNKI